MKFVCATIIMINLTNLAWTPRDYAARNRAAKRCSELYKDAPCLKKFYKYDFQSYSALCGSNSTESHDRPYNKH